MVHAFVLVDVAAGEAEHLLPIVREIDAVSEAYVVTGEFDVIAEMEGEEVYDVLGSVTRELRPLDGVGTTRTYVALE